MVGEIYKTTYWGDVSVVQYVNSKSVQVRFINTGNVVWAQRYAVLQGLVQDITERKRLLNEAREIERIRKEALIQEARERKSSKAKAKELAAKSKLRWYRIVCDFRCHFDSEGKLFLGQKLVDSRGCAFLVVGKNKHNLNSWLIRYDLTGNKYWYAEGTIKSGAIKDRNCPEVNAQDKLKRKKVNASKYESQRERRIKMASDYQRNNIERTRVRNRNRRALRMNASGSHTLAEVLELFDSQGSKCSCCGILLTEATRELDHKMPLVLGGSNSIENLQWLCQFCNGSKNGSHPDEWERYSNSYEFKLRRFQRISTEHEDWKSIVQSMPLLAEFLPPECSEPEQLPEETCR